MHSLLKLATLNTVESKKNTQRMFSLYEFFNLLFRKVIRLEIVEKLHNNLMVKKIFVYLRDETSILTFHFNFILFATRIL